MTCFNLIYCQSTNFKFSLFLPLIWITHDAVWMKFAFFLAYVRLWNCKNKFVFLFWSADIGVVIFWKYQCFSKRMNHTTKFSPSLQFVYVKWKITRRGKVSHVTSRLTVFFSVLKFHMNGRWGQGPRSWPGRVL